LPAGALSAVGIVSLAMVSTPIAIIAAQLSLKQIMLIGPLAAAVIAGVARCGVKETLLFFYVLSITYNRQYYSFNWLHGDLGARGLYWCPSDIFLGLLLIIWLVERARHARQPSPGAATSAWLLPLLIIATISVLASSEPLGSAMELLRLCKLALLLIYLRHNLDERGALAIIAGFAAAVIVQTPISILQALKGSGHEGLLTGIAQGGDTSEMAHRASGTLGHPNFLAPYLLMVVPGFAATAIGLWHTRMGVVAIAISLAGAVTIVLTQSRAPSILVGLSVPMVVALLWLRNALHPLRAVAVMVAALVASTAVAVPLADAIYRRLTGTLQESVVFRADYNRAAIKMWQTAPMLGVGPNNFVLSLGRYAPILKSMNDSLLETSKAEPSNTPQRMLAPVHNVYLLILSEMGLLGLFAFAIFLLRAVLLAYRASALAPHPAGIFSCGIFCGFVVQFVQQLVDFSLWWDPILFTFALLMSLCARFARNYG
jgi:O-antigen ligase